VHSIKEDLEIENNDITVGVIGNINPTRGYEYFLEIADQTRESVDHSVKFIIVGAEVKGMGVI